jgi:hypothetical protein
VSSVLSWEKATAALFDVIGLRTIQRKIIAFSLIATLIPSVTMGWLSYRNNRRVLDEKISQELNNLTSSASRELDLWITEHRYQARVLSSSYEVSENLAEITDPETSARAIHRLRGAGRVGRDRDRRRRQQGARRDDPSAGGLARPRARRRDGDRRGIPGR